MSPATDAQVHAALPLTARVARRHAHKLRDPATDRDDLQQAAAIGVLKASERWNGEGAFTGWAWHQMHGEVLHTIRDSVPGSRPDRTGSLPLRTVSIDAPARGTDDATLADVIPAPGVDLDLRLTMAAAVDGLPAHERIVVTGWLAGLSQSEIAARLGMTKHAVNKRFTKALGRLRSMPEIRDCQEAA